YVWDKRPGYFFIESWERRKRRRQMAGQTPSDALEAQRRKANELVGELIAGGHKIFPTAVEESATLISEAITILMEHVGVHSPDKPKTVQRYRKVLEHFARISSKRKFAEAITRSDIDDYKTSRSK